jgi:hypothetical protein
MARYRTSRRQFDGGLFLAYAGMETDLLFNKGVDLPGFTSCTFVETEKGKSALRQFYTDVVGVARTAGTGVILESPTWVANRVRGAAIGNSTGMLKQRNLLSI